MDRLELNEQLADIARELAEEKDGEQTLERAVRMPIELIEHCTLAGVSITHPQELTCPAVSHEDVRLLDELQHKLQEGPLIELRDQDSVVSGNVDTDSRWPKWGAQASGQFRIRSAMAFRLFNDGRKLAALSLYSEKPDAFTRDDHVDALVMAAQAAVAVAATLELDQMQLALRSRQTIGEAVGMLRERFGLTSEQAFGVLKRLSSQQNVKLLHIAQHVVETGSLPEPK